MELWDASEAAKYLRISVKNLYQLANQGAIPATRLGNKWVFTPNTIDEWIAQTAQDNVSRLIWADNHSFISAGSNDVIWEMLSQKMIQSPYGIFLPHASVGSIEGLKALKNRQTHSSCMHLFDPETGTYNIPFLKRFLKNEKVTVVHLFIRRQGFMVPRGNPKQIKTIDDLTRDDVRLINRQEGSGTRVLLDVLLQKNGVSSNQVNGYDQNVTTHKEVALQVSNGNADVGLGVASAASLSGLDFIELQEERYEAVILNDYINRQPVQVFLDFLKSNAFKNDAAVLQGYDAQASGTIIWEGSVQ